MRAEVVLLAVLLASGLSAATFYVDCTGGSDTGDGLSETSAWRSLEKVNSREFSPGDAVLFRRGTKCSGMLAPKGSGRDGAPIRIGAWGEGPLPLIDAGGAEAAVRLFNQQHWEIENLEASGGNPYGIYIGGDGTGTLRHFHLRNVVVRDVGGVVKTKSSGLIAVLADGERTLEDIVIDGATVHNTTQWAGIIVRGASREVRARNVTVRNCVVREVYGDGIVLFQVENGLVERSAAWWVGLQPVQTIGTPNGIWTWRCRNCVVQFTEGFFIDSPGVDGGVYDIDWGNEDNIVQYNYAHDAMGYCASVFGAQKETTINSIVRYNVCVNNGRSPKLARRQGDLYLSTWEGGSLDGVEIYNNTFYWNPPIDAPVLQMDHAEFTGRRPNVFRNNLIYSHVPAMVHTSAALKLDGNLYWHTGRTEPRWDYGGESYLGFAAYQMGSGQDAKGVYADPKLTALMRLSEGSPAVDAAIPAPGGMGERDYFGTLIPQGGRYDIGAAEFTRPVEEPPGAELRLREFGGRWAVLSFLSPENGDSRSVVVFLQSLLAQYWDKGLEVVVALRPGQEDENLRYDWGLAGIRLIPHPGIPIRSWPTTMLIAPEGKIVRRWEGFVMPADLGLAVRQVMGPPAGAPPIELPQQ